MTVLDVEVNESPVFLQEIDKKYVKGNDFTGGHATYQKIHTLVFFCRVDVLFNIVGLISGSIEGLFKPLSHVPLQNGTFGNLVLCDNDQKNIALFQCGDCKKNFCKLCRCFCVNFGFHDRILVGDEVFHMHSSKEGHYRKVLTGPEAKKRKNVGNCRCGAGAKRGQNFMCRTKRCPCFAEERGCVSCQCRECSNPFNPDANKSDLEESSAKIPKIMTSTLKAPIPIFPPSITPIVSSPFQTVPFAQPNPVAMNTPITPTFSAQNPLVISSIYAFPLFNAIPADEQSTKSVDDK